MLLGFPFVELPQPFLAELEVPHRGLVIPHQLQEGPEPSLRLLEVVGTHQVKRLGVETDGVNSLVPDSFPGPKRLVDQRLLRVPLQRDEIHRATQVPKACVLVHVL